MRASAFGDTSVRATIGSGSGAAAFAATAPGKVTIVLTNEQSGSQTVTVQLAGATPSGAAQWWRTSSNATITRQADVAFAGTSASLSLPARSIGMLVVPVASGGGNDGGTGGTDGGGDGGMLPPAPDAGTVGPDGARAPGSQGTGPSDVQGSCSTAAGGPVGVLALLLATLAFTRRRS